MVVTPHLRKGYRVHRRRHDSGCNRSVAPSESKKRRDKAQALVMAGLVLVGTLCATSGRAQSAASPVARGDTQVQVSEKLGAPKSRIETGNSATWYYEQGQIEFTNGRVSQIQWRKTENPPAQGKPDISVTTAVVFARPSSAMELAAPSSRSGTINIPYFTNRLSKGSVKDRREAAEVLKTRADPNTWDSLVQALEDTDGEVRCSALDALCQIAPQRSFDMIAFIALQHPDPDFRKSAIRRLCQMNDPRVVGPLITALGDPVPENAGAAAYELSRFSRGAFPQLEVAIRNPDPGVRRNAAIALAGLGNQAEAPLLEALRDSDAGVRLAVIEALRNFRSDRARDALRLLLSDPDASVRNAAETRLKQHERLAEEERTRLIKKQQEEERRRIAEAREQRAKSRQAVIGWTTLCLPGLLALVLVFRVQVLSEPPPLPLFSRILCLASALSLCGTSCSVLFHFYPSSLYGVHVDAWVLSFIFCLCASFTVMKCLRAAWTQADEALAGKTPRDAFSRLSVNGFLFLALAICLGSAGYHHMLHWQIGTLILTATLVIPCLILAGTNLSQRSRVRVMMVQSPLPDSDPEDIPERPMGVALFSILAMGIGLALITFGYFGITSDIPHMYSNSMSAGYGLLVGIIALALGLPAVVAGRSTFLMEESGRRLLVGFYWLLCVGPLIPLAIVALIYLTSSAVKEKFRYDIRERDGWDIARRIENRYWRWFAK